MSCLRKRSLLARTSFRTQAEREWLSDWEGRKVGEDPEGMKKVKPACNFTQCGRKLKLDYQSTQYGPRTSDSGKLRQLVQAVWKS